jgi:protein arginine N-methyltransferase 1
MYSVVNFGQMITDPVRIGPYVEALRRAVTPGSVVADIGCGTGFFALLACQYGARRVYAIEPNAAIHLARELATANDYQDRITFFQEMSTQVTLPERADVIISDLRGSLPYMQQHLPSIIDARRRLLAPGGVLIPQQDTVWATVVNVPDLYNRHVTTPWEHNDFGLDMRPGTRLVANSTARGRANPEQMLAEPQVVTTIDYTTVSSPDMQVELAMTIGQPGTGHGILAWFSTVLAPDIGFSTGPGQPRTVYGNFFFPWPSPVELSEGDTVRLTLQGTLQDGNYSWRWYTQVYDQTAPEQARASFKQGSMLGQIVTPEQIRQADDRHAPLLNERGQVDQFIMSLMDGTRSLNTIASQVMERFPERFSSQQEARKRVSDLSQRYSS